CGRCDCDRFAWTTLPGTADIAGRTDGPGGTFALVQFAGADTQTVVRLHEVPADAVRGRLIAPQDTLRSLRRGDEERAAGKVGRCWTECPPSSTRRSASRARLVAMPSPFPPTPISMA